MSKLAQACELSLNDWLATFPEEIPKAECSKKHKKWKRNLFNKMRDGYYHRFTTKTIKLMLVAAIITVLLFTAFVIPSSREFILDNMDDFSRFKITENNKNSVNSEITVGYVPEGYELDTKIFLEKQVIYRYINKDEDIFAIYKQASSMEVDFDTENYATKEIVVNDVKYIFCQGNLNVNNIVWTMNDYVYRVSGTKSFEELIKIAENIA